MGLQLKFTAGRRAAAWVLPQAQALPQSHPCGAAGTAGPPRGVERAPPAPQDLLQVSTPGQKGTTHLSHPQLKNSYC